MKKPPLDLAIGSVHKTNNYGNLQILEYENKNSIKVKFTSTGYVKNTYATNIRRGEVKDVFYPSLYGVGFVGGTEKPNKKIYDIWYSMIARCYCPKVQEKQPSYKGCTVVVEWHNFQNFSKWYTTNYVEGYELDKDIKVKGNKLYGPDTCIFASPAENVIKARAKTFKFLSPSKEVIEVYNLTKFCRDNNLNQQNMSKVHNNKRNHHKEWRKA